jgi:hypothetical protein
VEVQIDPLDHGLVALAQEVVEQVETTSDLRMFKVVTEHEELEDLTRDIAVLAPPTDLVVGEFRHLIAERCDLGIVVELGLPTLCGDTAEPVAAVNDREGPPQATSRTPSLVLRADEFVTPAAELRDGIIDPCRCAGKETDRVKGE